jgi:hypothetical protein
MESYSQPTNDVRERAFKHFTTAKPMHPYHIWGLQPPLGVDISTVTVGGIDILMQTWQSTDRKVLNHALGFQCASQSQGCHLYL